MSLEPQHGEGLIKGPLKSYFAEIVGAYEAIPAITKHPEASTTGEGWIDTGDPILFSEQTDVIGAFKEHFYKVGSCSTAAM